MIGAAAGAKWMSAGCLRLVLMSFLAFGIVTKLYPSRNFDQY